MSGGADGKEPAVPSRRLPVVPDSPPVVVVRTRLPAAAAPARGLSNLYLLSLLSAVDGTLVLMAASGQLSSLGGAIAVGLTVVAGAGAWIAAQQAFASRPRQRGDLRALAVLAAVTVASTVASVAVGSRLGQAATLHVLPKAAGIVLFLVAAEVAGWRLPRPARVPMPIWVTGGAGVLEVALRWTP
ncbi:MAG: hypothetical protein V4510_07460 [bacterium]